MPNTLEEFLISDVEEPVAYVPKSLCDSHDHGHGHGYSHGRSHRMSVSASTKKVEVEMACTH